MLRITLLALVVVPTLCARIVAPSASAKLRNSKLAQVQDDLKQTVKKNLQLIDAKAAQAPPQFFGSGGSSGGSDSGGTCHPKCWWTCGDQQCDEVCEPVCAPPQCETACAGINLATCTQECDPPKCAVVCPTVQCAHGDCPRCKTICGPPTCHTKCSEQCESKCADPQCTWKCTPPEEDKCKQPSCTMACGNSKVCNFNSDIGARPPPFASGMNVISKSLAALDPATLGDLAAGVGQGPAAAPASAF